MALFGAVAQYIGKEFGGSFGLERGQVLVTTPQQVIVDPNPDAMALTFINNGAEVVTLQPGDVYDGGPGIILQGNGGLLSLNARDDLILPAQRWFAKSNATGTTLYWLRVVRFSSS